MSKLGYGECIIINNKVDLLKDLPQINPKQTEQVAQKEQQRQTLTCSVENCQCKYKYKIPRTNLYACSLQCYK